jgi:hypothetical protein
LRRRGFVIDASCQFWFPFHRYGSEQSMIWDASGNSRHGTISDIIPSVYTLSPTGYEGWGWYFDFKNPSYMSHSSLNIGKTYTLHYWLKTPAETGTIHAGVEDYELRITDTTVNHTIGVGNTVAVSHNGAASIAKKTLISVRRVAKKVNFYQDGLLIGEEQTLTDDNDLTLTDIGRDSDEADFGFEGTMYEAVGFNVDQGFIGVRNFFEMTRRIQGI